MGISVPSASSFPLPFTGEGDRAKRGGEGCNGRHSAGLVEGLVRVAPPSTAHETAPLPRLRGRNDSRCFGGWVGVEAP